ncbi:hypothetical protein BDK51DRAFT_28123, partial [Blyttiomyces helicus]
MKTPPRKGLRLSIPGSSLADDINNLKSPRSGSQYQSPISPLQQRMHSLPEVFEQRKDLDPEKASTSCPPPKSIVPQDSSEVVDPGSLTSLLSNAGGGSTGALRDCAPSSGNAPPSKSARRATFQGRTALITAAHRRLSALDVNASCSSGVSAASGGSTSISASSSVIVPAMSPPGGSMTSGSVHNSMFASTVGFVDDDPGIEKPTILVHPRKSVVTRSNASLRDLSMSSRSGSMALPGMGSMSLHTTGSTRNLMGGPAPRAGAQGSGQVNRVNSGSVAATSEKDVSVMEAERISAVRFADDDDDDDDEDWAGGAGHDSMGNRLPRAMVEVGPALRIGPDSNLASTTAGGRPISTVGPMDETYRNNPEYYEYLINSQRHASSNFITRLDSTEVVWQADETRARFIGPYLKGDQIGKGSFGKVKEGICSETLQRVALKIIAKKRIRKVHDGMNSVLRLKHTNIVTLIDVFCKVEDDAGNVGVFNWFASIEDEPIAWQLEGGSEVE